MVCFFKFERTMKCVRVIILTIIFLTCVIYMISSNHGKLLRRRLSGVIARILQKSVHNQVILVGSNYNGEEINDLNGDIAPYILTVPHFMDPVVNSIEILRPYDQQVLRRFVDVLNASKNLDGIFGELSTKASSESLSHSPCQFVRRDSTILITNLGKFQTEPLRHQICNITQTSFLIRTEIFKRVQWKPERGYIAFLDFFVRSEGKIQLGKVNFTFSDDVNRHDRGLLKGTQDFPEYHTFGIDNGILRIIYEDRIEWTKCAATWKLCEEKPYFQPQNLPDIAKPICCSHCLDIFLRDISEALDKLGFKYRVVFGTVLGAVRSKAIIPWTYDIDFGITKKDYWSRKFYKKLQLMLGDKYWTGYSHDIYRVHPRFPASLKADFSNILRNNPDSLFTNDILQAMGELSPIVDSWRHRGYVDFYPFSNSDLTDFTQVTINGRNYSTIPDVDKELVIWYGKHYADPLWSGGWIGRTDAGHSQIGNNLTCNFYVTTILATIVLLKMYFNQ